MRSLLLGILRRLSSAARRTILYPPRWTSFPGGRRTNVINLGDARRRPADRRDGGV